MYHTDTTIVCMQITSMYVQYGTRVHACVYMMNVLYFMMCPTVVYMHVHTTPRHHNLPAR